MFCRYCGKNLLEDSAFCPHCGKNVSENQAKEDIHVMSHTFSDDEYYMKIVSKTANSTLVTISKICCYIALCVFLFFNIKMAPSYGWMHVILYIITGAIAIGLVVLFIKKVLPNKKKWSHVIALLISIIVITASIGLRIVYESKVDYVKTQIPSSGEILLLLSEDTEYYNSTGTGTIRNPSTNVRLGNDWYDAGDIISIRLNQTYSLRVGAGGSGSGGYADSKVTFSKSSFFKGKRIITKDVYISSGPASEAVVTLTFEKYCTFWEVIFY